MAFTYPYRTSHSIGHSSSRILAREVDGENTVPNFNSLLSCVVLIYVST